MLLSQIESLSQTPSLAPPPILVDFSLISKKSGIVGTPLLRGNDQGILGDTSTKPSYRNSQRNNYEDSHSLRLRWVPLTKPLPMSRRLILQQARGQNTKCSSYFSAQIRAPAKRVGAAAGEPP
ncbi:hypothetical protein R6Q57_007383 [Mikania cordata]